MKLQHHIDTIIVLDAIDRLGSFASAAEELHRATSSISYSIQKLETAIGVSLFDRNGHRATLTSAGKELLREGRSLLNSINNIERNVQLIADGWEAELRIAVNDIIPIDKLLIMLDEFYQTTSSRTRIRLSTETFLGPWDALIADRAELAIGVPADSPASHNFQLHPLATAEFAFVVSSTHPLADRPDPISNDEVRNYRAIAAADSSRVLQPRTFGLLPGQPVLTVSDQEMKQLAIKKGLGVGHLPQHMIKEDLDRGELVIKNIENSPNLSHQLYSAWPIGHKGKALNWFKSQFTKNELNILG